jgi:diadenosine tetraphosphate (Ap4A) HIT family hydrolase
VSDVTPDLTKVPMDIAAYERRVRSSGCFICALIGGEPGYEHEVVLDDGEHIAFLSKYPTVYGYLLVAPLRHAEHLARDLTADEYVRLQATVYRVVRALESVVPSERTYVLSLGSQQGNPHLHIHVVPLPPGTPYEQQQLYALHAENGVVPMTPQQTAELGAKLRAALATD